VGRPERIEPVDEVERFCRDLRPRLLGALRLEVAHHVAEELTQETLARVCDRWESVRAMRSPEGWAFRVAFNLTRSVLRRRVAERRALSRYAADGAPVTTGLDQADLLALREAVRDLAPRQRRALVLRYYADLPVEEVARVMGCTPATVRSHTRGALARLRQDGAGGRRGE